MNVLVLKPGCLGVEHTRFSDAERPAVANGAIKDYRGAEDGKQALAELRHNVDEAGPDVLAVRVIYGGETFRGPAVADADVIRQIEDLVPHAPLHLPLAVELLRDCEEVFPDILRVVVFETSFFVDLPACESAYALESGVSEALGVRRYGYHGVLHEAACGRAAQALSRRRMASGSRILSICLEAQPEVAAVLGHRPLMVTSGATPLEGIPGQHTCGAIDPSIVITIARQLGWGPEQINALLTQESGLLGLAGEPATFDELFSTRRDELRPVREMMRYRILLACGAGMAALGGLDAIVFSGRFAATGQILGPWLRERLISAAKGGSEGISVELFLESLDRVVADVALAAAGATGMPRANATAGSFRCSSGLRAFPP